MIEFETCTYLDGLCQKRGRCLLEGTMRNQMDDPKSWGSDEDSERVREKMALFIEAARKNNCPNLNALQTLVERFQKGILESDSDTQ